MSALAGEGAPGAKRLVIVSGLSGAGKTVVLHALEDFGFYCVDNLPAGFLEQFADLVVASGLPHYQRVAVGIDARNPAESLSGFPDILDRVRRRALATEIVFVGADEEVLLKRFSETRRRHPLSMDGVSLKDALDRERVLLGPIAEAADLTLDTRHTNIHQLREIIGARVARRAPGTLSLQVIAFGYKNGVPPDSDFVFDVRCLPNPHWEPALRPLTGRDAQVAGFLEQVPLVGEMISDICGFLDRWVPRFEADDRSYLTVAVGCTGGRHRSVYVAERLGQHFLARRSHVLVSYRDM